MQSMNTLAEVTSKFYDKIDEATDSRSLNKMISLDHVSTVSIS